MENKQFLKNSEVDWVENDSKAIVIICLNYMLKHSFVTFILAPISVMEQLKKVGHFRPLFLYFRLLYNQLTEHNCSIKFETWFEPGSSGFGSDRAVNFATTADGTALPQIFGAEAFDLF